MKLVPEHINEAIKHLGGRSEEEISAATYAELEKVELHEKFPYINRFNLKISKKEQNRLKAEMKKSVSRLNKLVNREIKALNKKYKLDLKVFQDKDLIMQTSSFSTFFSPFIATKISLDPADTGILSPIFKKIEVEYTYNIYPGAGFTVSLKYTWDMRHGGANGYNMTYTYDRDGILVNSQD